MFKLLEFSFKLVDLISELLRTSRILGGCRGGGVGGGGHKTDNFSACECPTGTREENLVFVLIQADLLVHVKEFPMHPLVV